MVRLCAPTDEAGRNLDEAIESMNKNDIHLAEIRGILDKNVLDLSTNEAKYCYEKLQENNIDVWSISSPIGKKDFSIPIEEFRNRIIKAIEMAKAFRCKNIRVFSFFNHNNDVDEVVKRISLCVEEAEKEGLFVCLENEKDSYAETAQRSLELLDRIPNLKLVYDSSNFIQVGEPSDMTLKRVFPRAYFVHFKDGIHVGNDADITPVGKGEANIEKLLQLCDNNLVLSLEHHLKFATEEISYEDIKNDCDYVYENVVDAFDDACKHAKIMLKQAGFIKSDDGVFIR